MFKWGGFSYSDCYSVLSEGLVSVFEWAIMLSLVILIFVVSLSAGLSCLKGVSFSEESLVLEFIWTLLPIMVLVFLAYPSMLMMFMYNLDSIIGGTIGVMGCQWYWVYTMDSGVLNSYPFGGYRLLDVDSRLVVNSGVNYKVYLTSTDVIHSWAIPSFGLKMDALPGRVNVMDLFCTGKGVYYGQCSELCGVGHSYMPICLEVVYSLKFFSI